MTTIQESEVALYIKASAEEVLEIMFFTPLMPDEEMETGGAAVTSSLSFRGTPSGTLQIEIAEPAARSLAVDFLGSEEEVPADKVTEVACELANMLCGSILRRVWPDGLFELSHPEPVPGITGEPSVSQTVCLPNGTLKISLQVGDTA